MLLNLDTSRFNFNRPVPFFNGKAVGACLVGGLRAASPHGQPVIFNSSGVPFRSGPTGGAYGGTGATNSMMKMRRAFQMSADVYHTLLCVFRTTSTTTNNILCALGADTGSAGNTLVLLRQGSSNAARINWLSEDANGTVYSDINTGSVTINDGFWHCAVGSTTAATTASGDCYIDGVKDGTLAPTAAAAPLSTTFPYLLATGIRRGGANTSGSSTSDVALVAFIYGRLTDAEGISLSANPWQLFEESNDVFDGSAAAATFQPAWAVNANSVMTTGARAA